MQRIRRLMLWAIDTVIPPPSDPLPLLSSGDTVEIRPVRFSDCPRQLGIVIDDGSPRPACVMMTPGQAFRLTGEINTVARAVAELVPVDAGRE